MAYNYQAYRPSQQVIDYKNRQDTATNNYNAYANTRYSQGAGGLGFQLSSAQARLDALYRGNTLSQQFRYDKQSQYDRALDNITNRKAFKYDLSEDQLFQQAKEQYQAMGKTAMQDTMGQAAAMTGGYGNSYATTASNQAYQSYLKQLNDSIGDYYAMALSAYNNETDRLNSVFGALSTDRAAKQGEWSSNWDVYNKLYGLYSNDVNTLRQQDLTAWQQKGANLKGAAEIATSQYSTASGNDINVWGSQEKLRATMAEQIETERANRANEDYRNRQLAEQERANRSNEDYRNRQLAEQERANRSNEDYRNRQLAEQQRANRSNEDYRNKQLNNKKKEPLTAEKTENAARLIKLIDKGTGPIMQYGGKKELLTYVDKQIAAFPENISPAERAYIYLHYGLTS